MNNYQPYPWQTPLWQGLVQRLQAQRLPHALLLSGPTGMGKRDFASRFAHAVLCDTPNGNGSACGQCRGCKLMQAGSHPDYLRVEPEEEGKTIGIDAVRELTRFQALKSQYGRQRVILLQPADALNANSSNALLKTLEEPAGETVLLLITDQPARLLPTIRSRCQQLFFRPLSPREPTGVEWLSAALDNRLEEASDLLQMAAGAPLRALQLANGEELALRAQLLEQLQGLERDEYGPVRLAQGWLEHGCDTILTWLYRVLADMLKLKLVPQVSQLHNPQHRQQLQALAEQVDLYLIQALLQRVQERRGQLSRQANPQVVLEELLLAWKQRRV